MTRGDYLKSVIRELVAITYFLIKIINRQKQNQDDCIFPLENGAIILNPSNPVPRIVRAIGKTMFNEQQEPVRLSGVLQDVTEQSRDEQRKNDFIGMVSHELKTPLTSLTAIVQVLNGKLKNSDDNFVAGAMDRAQIQVRKMSAMINGFLNISRLESGKI